MIEQLKKELNTATSFSVIMDEASDFGHKEQVSVVFQYVDTDYVIQERLVNIECIDSTDADSLVQLLLSSLSKVAQTTDKLIGQCYDGASNMRGHIAGVQAKVRVIQPKAIYTHCYAHCTNLVLVEATSTNQYARNFFGVLQNLYKFLEAIQVADTTIDTIKTMRNATTFKKFYGEASKMADNLGIEVSESHSRKVSCRLDENRENQHVMVSNEEMFRVTFFYEVLDVMISERGDLIKSQGSF